MPPQGPPACPYPEPQQPSPCFPKNLRPVPILSHSNPVHACPRASSLSLSRATAIQSMPPQGHPACPYPESRQPSPCLLKSLQPVPIPSHSNPVHASPSYILILSLQLLQSYVF
jgi:hypothetical protein